VQFTIGRIMAVVALVAVALRLSHNTPRVLIALGLGGLVLALTRWARAPKKGPSTEFSCTLIGIVMGLVSMPNPENSHWTHEFSFFGDLIWISGCASLGALVGAVGARTDRWIVTGRY
jgi:hypothetical protein